MAKMGLTPIDQRPRTSDPHPQHRIYSYLLCTLTIERPRRGRSLRSITPPKVPNHLTTEKRRDRSARCAEKHRLRGEAQRFHGLLRPAPEACAFADATRDEKRLPSGRIQAILAREGAPLGECRFIEILPTMAHVFNTANLEWWSVVAQW